MPRPEKGSKEAKEWAAKMKAARESKKTAPQLKASPTTIEKQKRLKGGMMTNEEKAEKRMLESFEPEKVHNTRIINPPPLTAEQKRISSQKLRDNIKYTKDWLGEFDKNNGIHNNSSSGKGYRIKGGFLQPDELPASMRFVADPMDIVNTKEGIIDGGNLKSMIEAFRRKWAGK